MEYKRYEEYKDSGIEWIGEIPKDWEVVRMRYLANITTGDKDAVDKKADGKYPFFVRSDKVERIDTYSFDGEAILTAGDGVGVGEVFHYYDGKFDYHQRVYKFSQFKNIKGKYLYFYLKNNLYKEILMKSAKTTVDSIRIPMLQNFNVLIPSLQEQQKIVSFLDEKTAQIDGIIEQEEALVEKLEKYKKSLIYEAVTGKIDLRDYEGGE
jgi:type I restriction enzyme S subunit